MDIDTSDEDRPLSPDSAYNSDEDDNRKQVKKKIVSRSEFLALDGRTKCCANYFYYVYGSDKMCVTCMIASPDTDEHIYTVRKHVTEPHDVINGRFCKNCGIPLYQILPCNMCPMCTK
jgi:hypothetical protein